MRAMSVEAMAEEVATLMAERLKIRGAGLAAKLRQSRKMLPREIRSEAALLAQALERAQVPKLQRQLDTQRLTQAYEACVAYLTPLGRAERRRGMMIGMLGNIGVATIATFTLVVGFLLWRGYL